MPRRVSLSLELLQTFLLLHRNDGDAAKTALELNINQPSISKRLSFLQHAGPVLDRPWLVRVGKHWKPTEEGERALPAVEEIVQRYEHLQEFVEGPAPGQQVRFAGGQHAVATFVYQAVRAFRDKHPDVPLRISTLRGRARIERVANGYLDLAAVMGPDDAIHEIARRPLYIRPLFLDPLALVCGTGSVWSARVAALPDGAKPSSLPGLPLILPERDASARQAFNQGLRNKGLLHRLDVTLEIGGWETLLSYVRVGLGVGVVSAVAVRAAGASGLIVRALDRKSFPPLEVRLIARRRRGTTDQPDLSPQAQDFHDELLAATLELGERPG